MSLLHVSLFGKFHARCGEQPLAELDACKVQELFSYLLLHSSRPHHRETLANLLWREQSPVQSKGYLRRTLWQLQNAIPEDYGSILLVDADWIQVSRTEALRLDVADFERAFARVKGQPGGTLAETAVHDLADAVQLYQGDLLEGWYQDWCLFERERLQQMLLMMLDKLMEHCESVGAYETGITYGMEILRYDLARERTHRRLMRLRYLSGDRTGALRQFERCTAVLEQELGVKPAATTERLRAQIETDRLDNRPASNAIFPSPSLQAALHRLQDFDTLLTQTHQRVRHEIHCLESALAGESR